MSTYSDAILSKLESNTQRFNSALDDFSNSYLNYKMYPNYNEYQQIYANSQGVIDALQAEVFIATNDVQKNIDNLNKLVKEVLPVVQQTEEIAIELNKK
jgi:hypothetical protein